jgi:hypothetical protein
MSYIEEIKTEIRGFLVVLFIAVFGVIGSILAIRSLFEPSEPPPQAEEQGDPFDALVE